MLWLRPVYLLVQTVSAWPASLACHRSTQGHFSQEIEMHTRFIVRGAGNRQPMRASTVAKVLLPVVAATCSIVFGVAGSAIAGIAPTATSDAEVLGIYIQVNGFEVETALLGRAQANSPTVRALAAQVASDHMGVRQAAFDLATTCKASPALPNNRAGAAIEHGRALVKLAALTRVDFDRAYMQHEVAFHRATIDAVRQVLLPSTTCAALKAHFKEVLPAMEHHLAETEALTRELTAR